MVHKHNRLQRLELLECGCWGQRLGRLRPRSLQWKWSTLEYTPEQLAWMHSWPEPTHACIVRPTLQKPVARKRQCTNQHELPDWAEIGPLVLHDPGDSCTTCNI